MNNYEKFIIEDIEKDGRKFYICDVIGCISVILASENLQADFEGMSCMLCKIGKYRRWVKPRYIGWRIEGEVEYKHKVKAA